MRLIWSWFSLRQPNLLDWCEETFNRDGHLNLSLLKVSRFPSSFNNFSRLSLLSTLLNVPLPLTALPIRPIIDREATLIFVFEGNG
ncbi:MAG TPA: hypothetical protein IGS40_26400 [Trichormus sp. M33_DOE_039]|nr:hypothetical protein [Trichormus sp. M33_DOE_039]